MAAGDWIADVWVQTLEIARRGAFCLNHVDAFEECRPYWAGLMYCLIGIGVIVFLVFLSHFIRYQLKCRAVIMRRKRELEVAPDEVMQEVKWSGDNALETNMSSAEIARRIKEEKERIKARAQDPKDPSKGDRYLGIDILHR